MQSYGKMRIIDSSRNEIYPEALFYESERIFQYVNRRAADYINRKNITVSIVIKKFKYMDNKEQTEEGISLAAIKIVDEKCSEEPSETAMRADRALLLSREQCIKTMYVDYKDYERLHNESKTVSMDEESLRRKIKRFVDRKNAYRLFDEEVKSRILGQPDISKITYSTFMWLKGLAYNRKTKNNIIIAAPSGSGKTETYRVIRDIIVREIGQIPVIQLDLTQLTPEGFSGRNCDEFFKPLLTQSMNGIAIVILDEMDKKLMPRYERMGGNVNSDIQAQILTIIEGTEFSDKRGDKKVDTSNTLFIAAGAFAEIRDAREEKANKGSFGFHTQEDEEKIVKEYRDITISDIVKAGAMKEIMGRFTHIVNYQLLNRECVGIIADRYAAEIEDNIGYPVELTEECVDYLYKKYSDGDFGCRIVRSELWNMTSDIGIEVEMMSQRKKNRIECIRVDADSVEIVMRPEKSRVKDVKDGVGVSGAKTISDHDREISVDVA